MISVIIITKNEEETIEACIKSVKIIAGEIVVLDAYSSDKTVEIAEKLGATVIKNRFDNFASQRNFALSLARNDWIFYIDADEKITLEMAEEIKETIKNYKENLGIAGYAVRRKTFFLNRDWKFEDRVERLFYKPLFLKWEGVVHETPKMKGEIGLLKSHLLHYTHRNLSQMVKKTNFWSDYEADLRIKSNHPKMSSWRFIRVMATGFLKSYFLEKGYKNGTEGVIESFYQAFSMFITYAKLWEKQVKKN